MILGEVESNSGNEYVYVFALVEEGQSNPVLYVVLERSQGERSPYQMQVSVEGQSKACPASDEMAGINRFSEMAVDAAVRLFKLSDAEAVRLL